MCDQRVRDMLARCACGCAVWRGPASATAHAHAMPMAHAPCSFCYSVASGSARCNVCCVGRCGLRVVVVSCTRLSSLVTRLSWSCSVTVSVCAVYAREKRDALCGTARCYWLLRCLVRARGVRFPQNVEQERTDVVVEATFWIAINMFPTFRRRGAAPGDP